MEAPSPRELSDLALDLAVEVGKLDGLVESLVALDAVVVDRLRVDAAALRLQSFYTGIERCLLQITGEPHAGAACRVLCGLHQPIAGVAALSPSCAASVCL